MYEWASSHECPRGTYFLYLRGSLRDICSFLAYKISEKRPGKVVGDLRIARARCAPLMSAILTLNRFPNEQTPTLMTCSANSLSRCFTRQFFARCTIGHCEISHPLREVIVNCNAFNCFAFALGDLGSLAGERWTFFATSVLAITADLIRRERCLATVTFAMDPHADFLLNPWCTIGIWHGPFARLQGQSVFGEHRSSLLLLYCAVFFGRHG